MIKLIFLSSNKIDRILKIAKASLIVDTTSYSYKENTSMTPVRMT